VISFARLRLLAVMAMTAGLAGSSEPPRPTWSQDAYVWQRSWTPAVVAALQDTSPRILVWRVLAAQADGSGHLHAAAIDADALRHSGRPVILVVRIEGQLLQWDAQLLLDDLRALPARWPADRVPLAGIEIDHDCATARLAFYADFLRQVRAALPATLRLSITALPAWLSAAALRDVLAPIDEAVLQVHAVSDPHTGLIDADQALRWAASFDRRTTKPFRVALPTYGSRVAWDDDGAILTVESERPRLTAGTTATELMAAPQDMAALGRALAEARLRHLSGIAWFRLPTDADRRAWSRATWRAVVDGAPLVTHVAARVAAAEPPGLHSLTLVNDGDVDAALPRTVALPPACRVADGIGPYRLERDGAGLVLRRAQTGRLPGHRTLKIGWMRCDSDRAELHVEP
jgi:Protein of unknown function (DUF3142)